MLFAKRNYISYFSPRLISNQFKNNLSNRRVVVFIHNSNIWEIEADESLVQGQLEHSTFEIILGNIGTYLKNN